MEALINKLSDLLTTLFKKTQKKS